MSTSPEVQENLKRIKANRSGKISEEIDQRCAGEIISTHDKRKWSMRVSCCTCFAQFYLNTYEISLLDGDTYLAKCGFCKFVRGDY